MKLWCVNTEMKAFDQYILVLLFFMLWFEGLQRCGSEVAINKARDSEFVNSPPQCSRTILC